MGGLSAPRPGRATERAARWVVRRAAGLLLALVALNAVAMVGALRLDVTSNLSSFYAQSAGMEVPARRLLLLLPRRGTPDDEAGVALAATLGSLAGVQRVVRPHIPADLELSDADREALRRQAWGGADDADWDAIIVTLSDRADSEDIVGGVREATSGWPGGEAVVVGTPVLDVEHARAGRAEQRWAIPAVFVLFAGLLAALTRRVAGVLLPLVSIASSGLLIAGVMGWAGMQLGGPTLLLLPMVFILGLADSVHLLRRYGVERESSEAREALVRALVAVAPACLLTTLTTAVGFLVLGLSDAPMLRQFGVLAAIGMGLAWVAGLGVPSVVLALAPRLEPCAPTGSSWWTTALERVHDYFGSHRRLGWLLLATVGTASLATLPWVHTDLRLMGEIPSSSAVLAEHRRVDDDQGGLFPLDVQLHTEHSSGSPRAYEELLVLKAHLDRQPQVGSAVSVAHLAHWLGRSRGRDAEDLIGRRWRPDRGRRLRSFVGRIEPVAERVFDGPVVLPDDGGWHVWVRLHATGARDWSVLLDSLRELDRVRLRESSVELEGYGAVVVAAWQQLQRDVWWVVGAALLAAGLTLFGLLRAPLRAAWAVIPLLGTTGVVLATLAGLGIPVTYTNLFVLSASLGLGVDALIHLHLGARNHGMRAAFGRAGVAICWSTLLLLGGLAVLLTSELDAIRDVGLCLIVGMAANPVLVMVALASEPFGGGEQS